MKITIKQLSVFALEENDENDIYEIEVNGEMRISANDYGEPEDNRLSRDLNFVYNIVPLMKEAYEAGKNGEEMQIVNEKVDSF